MYINFGTNCFNFIVFSTVRAYLDMTNQHVGHIIKLRLSESYISFSKDLLSSCSFPPDMVIFQHQNF